MIVSHKYRFIFIKTVKTAGTSIETYLSGVCGDEDIVTPVDPPEAGHRPRNHAGFYNHMQGREIRARLGQEVWSGYFKFCFERNPWDKMVSWYFYWKTRFDQPAVSFQEFLQRRHFPRDFDKYSIDDGIAVDFIGQYENLLDDFRRVCGHLGIPVPERLPRAKDGQRENRQGEMYTETTRTLVAVEFAREIQYFGYRFGQRLEGVPPANRIPQTAE